MKKIIAAAAGLMIAGTAMATVASAAIEFSGDARVRYYFEDKFTGDAVDKFNNRFRMQVKATTAGGSYAITKFRVDNTFGGTPGIGDNAGIDVAMENAYIGVPLGCIELTAGRQPLNLMTSYFNDAGVDNVRVKYAQDGTTLVAYYGVIDSDYGVAGDPTDERSSEDQLWGAFWAQEWTADWSTQFGLSYFNNDLNDNKGLLVTDKEEDGLVAAFGVKGQAGPVALAAELGYQEEGVAATDVSFGDLNNDDAFGFFATAGMDFDALGATLVVGYGDEGYAYDAAVGFMILGGDGQLTQVNIGGMETWFAGIVTTYQATEELGFTLNLAYVDMEGVGAGNTTVAYAIDDNQGFEVSAQAAYAVNDGTMLYARAGMLSFDDDIAAGREDTAYGAGLSLELSF